MKTKEKLPKLYGVTSVVKKYDNYKEVPFNWFVSDRKKPLIPYEKAIMNYVKGDGYSEGAIDESFTKQEADQLVTYLQREHKEAILETNIVEEKLPIASNSMGFGATPVGGGDGFYMLEKEKNYNLPFKIWGYFDLRNCKNVNEKTEESEEDENEHNKKIEELEKLSIQELNERREVIRNEKVYIGRVIKAKNIVDSYKKDGFIGVYKEIADLDTQMTEAEIPF